MNPICPSILTTNYFNLDAKLGELAKAGIDILHLDVMDGHFVDTISFGPQMLSSIRERFHFQYDCHLMVANPSKQIPFFLQAGANWVSFHAEVEADLIAQHIALVHGHGCKAGLVLNPDTPLDRAWPFLKKLDYILLMSVFPGHGGQAFIPGTIARVAALKERILAESWPCQIQVDGGINASNIAELRQAGADLFVIGTFLYNSQSIDATVSDITHRIQWSKS